MDSEVTSIEMKPANQGVTNLGYRSTEVRTALHVISNKRPTGFNGHMGEHKFQMDLSRSLIMFTS